MTAPDYLPKRVADVWDEVEAAFSPTAFDRLNKQNLEAYCGQVATMREAQQRVSKEGIIIADAKGDPIEHPAIGIVKRAQEQIRAWGTEFKPKAR